MIAPRTPQIHCIPDVLPIHSAQRPDSLSTPAGHRWALLHANHAQARLIASSASLQILKPHLEPGAARHAAPDELHLVKLLPPFHLARPGILHHDETPIHAEAEFLNPSTLLSTAAADIHIGDLPALLKHVATAIRKLCRKHYTPHPSHLHYHDSATQRCLVSAAGALLATVAGGMHRHTILPGQLPPDLTTVLMAADHAFHGNFTHAHCMLAPRMLAPRDLMPKGTHREQELFHLRIPCPPHHCFSSHSRLDIHAGHLLSAAENLERSLL